MVQRNFKHKVLSFKALTLYKFHNRIIRLLPLKSEEGDQVAESLLYSESLDSFQLSLKLNDVCLKTNQKVVNYHLA